LNATIRSDSVIKNVQAYVNWVSTVGVLFLRTSSVFNSIKGEFRRFFGSAEVAECWFEIDIAEFLPSLCSWKWHFSLAAGVIELSRE
jgi:hypothetical protein